MSENGHALKRAHLEDEHGTKLIDSEIYANPLTGLGESIQIGGSAPRNDSAPFYSKIQVVVTEPNLDLYCIRPTTAGNSPICRNEYNWQTVYVNGRPEQHNPLWQQRQSLLNLAIIDRTLLHSIHQLTKRLLYTRQRT